MRKAFRRLRRRLRRHPHDQAHWYRRVPVITPDPPDDHSMGAFVRALRGTDDGP